jgi:nitrite reductase/ring-hydroxylating ferredoxin subunit
MTCSLANISGGGGAELNEKQHSRRDFLSRFGWFITLATAGGFSAASIRYLWPNVLYEPPMEYRIGGPSDYPEGVAFVADKRIFVVRNGNLIKVVSAVCTHIGCTVRWNAELNRWECPCHGSNFNNEGIRITGPARNPLPWYSVSLTPDGRLFVNERRIVPFDQELSLKT